MRYIPHTESEVREMLAVIGAASVKALFEPIPHDVRHEDLLALPGGLGEADVRRIVEALARRNGGGDEAISFVGGGVYAHHIPSAVGHLLMRSEFYTSYTPYQPEISQGTLQSIFEFQTMIASLLGTDVANASLYDGSTAMTEAIRMSMRCTRRSRAVLAGGVHPEYVAVATTSLHAFDDPLVHTPLNATGGADLDAVRSTVDGQTACLVLQQPSFFGAVEDVHAFADIAHAAGALLVVVVTDATAFGLLEAPGLQGADIVCGEGQAIGVPPGFGGPHVGLMGTSAKWLRQLPGRLVGQATDGSGEIGYVLTLSTREQHIRREKATSNICTNQGLMALASTITMALLGPAGLRQMAEESHAAAVSLRRRLAALPGFSLPLGEGPIYHEFVVATPAPANEVVRQLADRDIAAGLPLGAFGASLGAPPNAAIDHWLLINTTELHRPEDHDRLVAALA